MEVGCGPVGLHVVVRRWHVHLGISCGIVARVLAMDDWQSYAAGAVVLAAGLLFVFRFFRAGKGCGGCGGECVRGMKSLDRKDN